MVTTTHEEVLGVTNLPCEHHHNDFDREGTSVDEVTIEDVWVFFRRIAIQLKDVHQVVVLSMDVSTDRDFFQLIDSDINKSVIRLKDLSGFLNNHSCVLLVDNLAVSLPFHKCDTPLSIQIID